MSLDNVIKLRNYLVGRDVSMILKHKFGQNKQDSYLISQGTWYLERDIE